MTIQTKEALYKRAEELETDEDLSLYERCVALVESIGLDWLDHSLTMECASGYAEPGYSAREDVVISGDWNEKKYGSEDFRYTYPGFVCDIFDSWGVECEWYDEWYVCTQCDLFVRTKPNSYRWKRSYGIVDDEVLCKECIGKYYIEEYIDGIKNNPNTASTFITDEQLENLGFERVNNDPFANGWFDGQTDDPETILSTAMSNNPDKDYVFTIDENSQFYSTFSLWERKKNDEQV